jgi:hypothetical protein
LGRSIRFYSNVQKITHCDEAGDADNPLNKVHVLLLFLRQSELLASAVLAETSRGNGVGKFIVMGLARVADCGAKPCVLNKSLTGDCEANTAKNFEKFLFC